MIWSQTPTSCGCFKKPKLILHKSSEGDENGILSQENEKKIHVHISEVASPRQTEGRLAPPRMATGLEHFVFLVLWLDGLLLSSHC